MRPTPPLHLRTYPLSSQVVAESLSATALRADLSPLEQRALLQAAEGEQRRATRKVQPILDLPLTATQTEMRRARRTRAVRRGKDVYLPSWQELCTAMPNALLRSALWSVKATRYEQDGATGKDALVQGPGDGVSVSVQGDATLINRGPTLGAYDRRVFAACLDYYRDDRPLNGGEDATWIEESFFKFIEGLGSKYHPDGHRALRASLERLSAMSLHVRVKGLEVQLPRILEVSFADGDARNEAPQSSDRIYFRVLAPFAQLYGHASWTAVPHAALEAGKGMRSWVATYYSTHSKPFETKLTDLHKLSGSAATFTKFKGQLRDALDELKASDVPLEARIERYETDAMAFMDSKTITVHMAAWAKGR